MTSPMPLEDLNWTEDALATLTALARTQLVVTAEDLMREMRPAPHPNMVGSVFMAAKSLHFITPTGYRPSNSKSRRGGVIRTWTLHPMERERGAA